MKRVLLLAITLVLAVGVAFAIGSTEPEPEEPVVVDYEKEGEYIQNFKPLKKK